MHLVGTEALQLCQIPREARAAELAAKAGVGACDKPMGNPSMFVSCAQVQTKLARTRAILEAAKEAGGHFLLGEQLAAPLE